MTRRGRMKVEEDSQVQMLLAARTPVVTIVGKTWPLHVTEVFGVSLEENLAMIADTVRFLKENGREVFYDAEHFFDSFRENPDYSLATIKAAHDAGADLIVLCDTNGVRCRILWERRPKEPSRILDCPLEFTPTTMPGSAWPMRSSPSKQARSRLKER